jgi:hypothetical protein
MKLQKVVPIATFVFIIACGTVMLPIDSLIHWGDVGHTANIVNQYLVWETVEVDASLINVDPTLAAQTPDAVGPLLETPQAMIEFMAAVAAVFYHYRGRTLAFYQTTSTGYFAITGSLLIRTAPSTFAWAISKRSNGSL